MTVPVFETRLRAPVLVVETADEANAGTTAEITTKSGVVAPLSQRMKRVQNPFLTGVFEEPFAAFIISPPENFHFLFLVFLAS